ncbi:MAG TPA: hypothetical protein VFR24_27200 [Candidatus Angelobacter sp.]|nr:hypothetical protein [Candidatus Angelobacter sp.]
MNRKELVKKLELLKPALSEELSAIFGCYVFKENALYGWNGSSLAIVAPFEWDGTPFAVNGKAVLGLLQNCSFEDVDFTFTKTEVEIEAGKSQFKLPILGKDAFIFDEPEVPETVSFDVGEQTAELIEICRSTSATDHTLPALMGICFDLKNGYIYSSEGDVITRAELGGNKKGIYTVPNLFIDAFIKIRDDLENKVCTLAFTDEWVCADFEDSYTVYGRTIKSTVDFAKLIDKTLKGKEIEYTDLPEGFGEALARARVLTDAESKPTFLGVEGGKLLITAESSYGELYDELPFKGHEDLETTSVHAQLVERALKFCDRIALLPNCTCYSNGTTIFHLIGNAK